MLPSLGAPKGMHVICPSLCTSDFMYVHTYRYTVSGLGDATDRGLRYPCNASGYHVRSLPDASPLHMIPRRGGFWPNVGPTRFSFKTTFSYKPGDQPLCPGQLRLASKAVCFSSGVDACATAPRIALLCFTTLHFAAHMPKPFGSLFGCRHGA